MRLRYTMHGTNKKHCMQSTLATFDLSSRQLPERPYCRGICASPSLEKKDICSEIPYVVPSLYDLVP